jgi:hybrid cluster-associated redox disulfide protein
VASLVDFVAAHGQVWTLDDRILRVYRPAAAARQIDKMAAHDRNNKGVVAVSTDSSMFHQDLTVGEAFALHPGARAVFANFHLGGCAHCAISEFETIEQVSEGYGIPLDMILGALNALESPVEVQKAS